MNRTIVMTAILAGIAGSAFGQLDNPDFRFRARLRTPDNGGWSGNSAIGNADFRVHSRFLQLYYGGVHRLDEFRCTFTFDFTGQSGYEIDYANSPYNTDYDIYIQGRFAGRVDMNAVTLGVGELQYDSRHADLPTLPLPADFPDPVLPTDSVTVLPAALFEPAMSSPPPVGVAPLFAGSFSEEFVRGDANQDRKVDEDDFIFLAASFDPCGGANPHFGPAAGDFTGDNASTIADYNIMATNWTSRDPIPAAPAPTVTAPSIIANPISILTCPSRISTFRVTVAVTGAATYRWQRETAPGVWSDLFDSFASPYGIVTGAGTSAMSVRSYTAAAPGNFRCHISNGCGTAISEPASLAVCVADFDCDGGVDGDDVIGFFGQWDANRIAADVNRDTVVDGDDVIAFFEHWDNGC